MTHKNAVLRVWAYGPHSEFRSASWSSAERNWMMNIQICAHRLQTGFLCERLPVIYHLAAGYVLTAS